MESRQTRKREKKRSRKVRALAQGKDWCLAKDTKGAKVRTGNISFAPFEPFARQLFLIRLLRNRSIHVALVAFIFLHLLYVVRRLGRLQTALLRDHLV